MRFQQLAAANMFEAAQRLPRDFNPPFALACGFTSYCAMSVPSALTAPPGTEHEPFVAGERAAHRVATAAEVGDALAVFEQRTAHRGLLGTTY